jgi:DNA polymerase-3 subunit alpha
MKANYPSEYMAAVLSRNLADIKSITQYMTECKHMGINVFGPDINESEMNFSSNKAGDIRFGLAAVKGVGEAAVKAIIEERKANGPFKNIYDFVERVNFNVFNRKCMENLAYAGGFDSIIDFHRSKFFAVDTRGSSPLAFLEQLMRYGQRVQQEKVNSQQSLFGGGSVVDIQPPTVPVAEDWNQLQVLNKEREMIGLYLSAHPLDDYSVIINHMCKASLTDLSDLEQFNGQEIGVAGVVTSVQEMTTKTGRHWGKFTMEDYNSTHEFALFGKDYENFRQYLFPNYFLFVKGKVQPRPYGDNPELEFKIVSMVQLSEVQDSMIKELHVHLPIEELTQSFVTDFAEKVKSKSNKKANIILRMTLSDRTGGTSLNMYSKRYKIILEQDFIDYLDRSGLKYTLS